MGLVAVVVVVVVVLVVVVAVVVVKLDFTPEIEVFCMLFGRFPTENRKISLKQHTK